jgi:hypothetical protein
LDAAIGGQVEVANGRKVVQVSVAIDAGLQLGLVPAEFFVLHFQFDLVDFEFVLESAHVGLGFRRAGLVSQI